MGADPFNLDRFLLAQERIHETALAELRAGRKRSHWMWFVFPQVRGLGASPMATFYGVASIEEAQAYLAHPTLGPRLGESFEATLDHAGRDLRDIFESPDDMKFRSSATLFAQASLAGGVFERALVAFCAGERDEKTLERLAEPKGR
ncbi:uncharacterized protein (DUF1810 family) [Methylopila capsulata]|uniref:Uncharacterized protein (DUF1810 family) n=1 Tax=Methylopila capsulata TaxID=61654 RepID=A0A9W6MRW5_9HYPH|nr:DUF1810 domain-containing protein [Methylopila capsulata]MBM7850085.1 uncharacterized protein (DUF1810 family) [Methylopila capsulata]GLK55376.1 hypothetical protein GCM10008170_13950 [Methylopila capsulata]